MDSYVISSQDLPSMDQVSMDEEEEEEEESSESGNYSYTHNRPKHLP